MNPVGNKTYYYNNVALNAFQTYSVLVDFADWGGNAEIELYWKTNTISIQTIPKENLSTPYDAASSPYQNTVNCPIGYKVGGAVMNQWVLNCGDGLVIGTEVWDDANSVSEDGWSSDCSTIENGWIWINGNTTHQSDCSMWNVGYQPISTKKLMTSIWNIKWNFNIFNYYCYNLYLSNYWEFYINNQKPVFSSKYVQWNKSAAANFVASINWSVYSNESRSVYSRNEYFFKYFDILEC